jgi:hypothetical protein
MITNETLAQVRTGFDPRECPDAANLSAHLFNITRATRLHLAGDFVLGAESIQRGRLSGEWIADEIKKSFADDLAAGFDFYVEAIKWANEHF